jgi:hypothetical protein
MDASLYVTALAAAVSAINLYRFVGCTIFILVRVSRGLLFRICPGAYGLEKRVHRYTGSRTDDDLASKLNVETQDAYSAL